MKLLRNLRRAKFILEGVQHIVIPIMVLCMASCLACLFFTNKYLFVIYLWFSVLGILLLVATTILNYITQSAEEIAISNKIINHTLAILKDNDIFANVECNKQNDNCYYLKLYCSNEMVDKITLEVLPSLEEYSKNYKEYFTIKTEITYNSI